MNRMTDRISGPALPIAAIAAFFAANFALHHWQPFGASRIAYYLVVVLGFGTGLTLAVAARLDVALLTTGFHARRPILALLLAALAGGVLVLATVGGIVVAVPQRALNLFVWLWMTSVVEVLVFLGLAFNVARTIALERLPGWLAGLAAVAVSSLLFGAYHFTYSPPWNTLGLATTVAVVWIFVAAMFVASGSFWAAVVFNNCAATVGFLRNDIRALDGEPLALGLVLDVLLVVILAFGTAWFWPRRPTAE